MFLTVLADLMDEICCRRFLHNNLQRVSVMRSIYAVVQVAVCVSAMLLATSQVSGQGCVVVRGGAMCGTNSGTTINLQQGEFNLVLGARNFTSFRHFRGDHEEAFRVAQGTEVINKSSFVDLSINYGITDRLFATVILPFVYNDRSSLYEHGGNPRFDAEGNLIGTWKGDRRHTYSSGLADIRFSVGYWLFDPMTSDYNYSVSLGVKTRTGSYDYTGTFYNQGPNRDQTREGVVDQSIQPGDGGIGATIDVQGIHPIADKLTLVTSLFYLANVTNTNGVLLRTSTPDMRADTSQFSAPDQFGVRVGAFYTLLDNFSVYGGGRVEGIPSTDLIGGSGGFRRPGYAVSVEPGLSYFNSDFSVVLSVPIAVYRNRTQSYIDKIRTEQRGVETIGDAAFADYLISLGISYRFGSSGAKHAEM